MADHCNEQMNDLDGVSTVDSLHIPFYLCPARLLAQYPVDSFQHFAKFLFLRVLILCNFNNIQLSPTDGIQDDKRQI